MAVEATKQVPTVQTPPVAASTPATQATDAKNVDAAPAKTPAEANKENLPPDQGKKLDVIA